MNLNRGHENLLHLQAKAEIGRLFHAPDWAVFYEQRCADILVMHCSTRFIAAIEAESTYRNVVQNLNRNLGYECHAVAVISLNDRFHGQIESKALCLAAARNQKNIRVFRYREQEVQELFNWIDKLTRTHVRIREAGA
ncbi:MAG: hypothetical protein WCH86_00445 [Kiritimatiellales bacterium]